MNKMTKYFLIIIISLVAGGYLNTQISRAASAEVDISASSTEVTVGGTVYVNLTITSDSPFGDFEANLTYDGDILEYKGKQSFITGSNGFLKISDLNVADGDTVRKYALEFKATEIGISDVSLMEPFMVYDYETGIGMPVSANVLSVHVSPAETASDNAYLSSLKISPSELTPAFDKNTFEYTTTVGYETEKLVINADREDPKAVVKISGNDSLKEGENNIIVTVIAESGTVIEYNIEVFREYAPAEGEATEDPTITPSKKHGSFEVVRMGADLFAVYEGRYKLVEPGPEVKIPSGYIKTKIIISDISIDVYAPEDNLGYEFLLLYAENELGEAGFYSYDRVERTMQRCVPEDLAIRAPEADNLEEINNLKADYRANIMKAVVIITLLSVLCAVLIVLCIRFYMKSQAKSKRHIK